MVSGVTMHARLWGRLTQTNTDKLTFNYIWRCVVRKYPSLTYFVSFFFFRFIILAFCIVIVGSNTSIMLLTTLCLYAVWCLLSQCELLLSNSSLIVYRDTLFGYDFNCSEIRGKMLLSTNSFEFEQSSEYRESIM